jgi:hypothetical protein
MGRPKRLLPTAAVRREAVPPLALKAGGRHLFGQFSQDSFNVVVKKGGHFVKIRGVGPVYSKKLVTTVTPGTGLSIFQPGVHRRRPITSIQFRAPASPHSAIG